jgi:hypothetical protein
MPSAKRCKDCAPGAPTRPVKAPGPRCATHMREHRRRLREANWARYIEATYSITADVYWEIYNAQGGVCGWCGRATGRTKHLSVDHDHACCPGKTSCGLCVRGLLCSTCNKLLGHMRDDPDTIRRGAGYIERYRNQRMELGSWRDRT